MLRPISLTAGLGLLALAACQPSGKPQLPTAADTAAIEKIRTDYVAAWNAGKVDDVLRLYAGDAQLLPADQPPLSGSNALRTYFNTELGTPTRPTLAVPPGTLLGRQDLVVYVGSDTLTILAPAPAAQPARRGRAVAPPAGPTVLPGKYIVVLMKQADGGWKITHHAEMPNAPMPMPPKPAANP
jgi:ketosteroid isomerase-like protein